MENQLEPRPPRVTAAEADALLEEQKTSGLSIAAFAKAKDVPPWSIYNARARARKKAMAQFAEVSVVPLQNSPSPPQSELELTSEYLEQFIETHIALLKDIASSQPAIHP